MVVVLTLDGSLQKLHLTPMIFPNDLLFVDNVSPSAKAQAGNVGSYEVEVVAEVERAVSLYWW